MNKKYFSSGVTSGAETDKTINLRATRDPGSKNLWATSGVEINSNKFLIIDRYDYQT